MNIKILLVCLVGGLAFLSNFLYSQDLIAIDTKEDLGVKGDVISVYEKEIAVTGQRHNLIRRNVISEVKYFITDDNEVRINFHQIKGIVTEYKYNAKNQIVEVVSFYPRDSSSAGKTIFHYDASGNLIYEIVFTPRGKLKDSVAIFENETNNSIIRKYFNDKNENYKTEEKWRNAAARDVKVIQTVNNSTIRLIYEYDFTLTRMIEERWYLGSKLVQKLKYEYDEKGHLIRKIEFDDRDRQSALTRYEYDILSGLVVAMKTANHTIYYEYNFDNNDNWITKYEFYDDFPVKIIEREIKYRE